MAKSINNWYLSGIVVIVLIAVMTIASELYPAFKDLLRSLLWNHWIAKSVISIVVFGVLGKFFTQDKIAEKYGKSEAWWLEATIATSIVSGLVIFGFYLQHYLG